MTLTELRRKIAIATFRIGTVLTPRADEAEWRYGYNDSEGEALPPPVDLDAPPDGGNPFLVEEFWEK